MNISKPCFAYPVLLEQFSIRTPDGDDIEELEADIAVGTLKIDTDIHYFAVDTKEVLAYTPADESDPRLMTDGKVAYVSEEHGHPTLYVREPGRHAEPIDPALEVSSHIVSPDGNRLLFTDRRGWVRQWTEKNGIGKPFLKVGAGSKLLGLGKDGQSLIFSKERSTSFEVYSHDLVNQQTGLLFKDHNRTNRKTGVCIL